MGFNPLGLRPWFLAYSRRPTNRFFSHNVLLSRVCDPRSFQVTPRSRKWLRGATPLYYYRLFGNSCLHLNRSVYSGMPKRSSKKKAEEPDPNELAKSIVDQVTSKSEDESPPEPDKLNDKNPAAVALGKLGGKKGGPARAKKLSKKRRSEIAKKAARARWTKR